MLEPYIIWIRLAVAVVILGLIGYTYYVFQDRTSLQAKVVAQQGQLQAYQESMARDAKVREAINDAVSKIKITSNNYIKAIDTGKPVDAANGTVVQLVAGGMLARSPNMSAFTSATSAARAANSKTR